MIERKIPMYRKQFPTRHDKAVRAQAIRGRMSLAGFTSRCGHHGMRLSSRNC